MPSSAQNRIQRSTKREEAASKEDHGHSLPSVMSGIDEKRQQQLTQTRSAQRRRIPRYADHGPRRRPVVAKRQFDQRSQKVLETIRKAPRDGDGHIRVLGCWKALGPQRAKFLENRERVRRRRWFGHGRPSVLHSGGRALSANLLSTRLGHLVADSRKCV